jgi:predicted transcriptional regulator
MRSLKVTVRAQDEPIVDRAREIAEGERLPFSRLVVNLLAQYVERHNHEEEK